MGTEINLTVKQLTDLFNIARGTFYNYEPKYAEMFGINWIQLEDSGYRLHHFRIVNHENIDVRFGDVYDFEYFTTDLRGDDRKIEVVKNTKLLHEKLTEFGFY